MIEVKEDEDDNIFDSVFKIFEKLNGSVFRPTITSTKFRKLAKLNRLVNDKLSVNSFEIIF